MKIQNKPKKRILLDLDVVTVGLWDKGERGDAARVYMEKIRRGDIILCTSYHLLELVNQWKHERLKDQISEFFELWAARIYSTKEILENAKAKNIDYSQVINALIKTGEKEEGTILVLITSIFQLDALITFNRVHLKNNQEMINQILTRNNMEVIKIEFPN